jgi:hypothetical protein
LELGGHKQSESTRDTDKTTRVFTGSVRLSLRALKIYSLFEVTKCTTLLE